MAQASPPIGGASASVVRRRYGRRPGSPAPVCSDKDEAALRPPKLSLEPVPCYSIMIGESSGRR
jgi:hypothetical protein